MGGSPSMFENIQNLVNSLVAQDRVYWLCFILLCVLFLFVIYLYIALFIYVPLLADSPLLALRWFVELDRSKKHSWTDLANAFLTQYKFNTEIAPDRIDLQRMQKRNNESFRAYAQRWRELAAQVKPSMTEREMIGTFINTLREPYLSHLVGHTKSSFADLVIVGDRVEDALKSGRLMDVQALQSLLEQPGAGTSHKRVTAKKQDPGSKEVQTQASIICID